MEVAMSDDQILTIRIKSFNSEAIAELLRADVENGNDVRIQPKGWKFESTLTAVDVHNDQDSPFPTLHLTVKLIDDALTRNLNAGDEGLNRDDSWEAEFFEYEFLSDID
jgi:hypothetical protein